MASVEKTYSDALFALLEDENAERTVFDLALNQLGTIQNAISETPNFVKLLNTPTISDAEKLSLVDTVFSGKVDSRIFNFLRLLTVKKRMSYFPQIYRAFRGLYNEKFGIAEIVVTSSMPLTDDLRNKIIERMSKIIGKTVSLTEKIDKTVIGGVVVDYGNTRLDGSVKTRLAELKNDISSIIA
ncbi:MAG: ATP synthase F1 subunit delta [Oscillospiraceae bacterium]|nr:ATP synthase F1 subunit delta [Oscillospiraceae bacterium]